MPFARTSQTHPLCIAELPLSAGGLLGLTFCPGKIQSGGLTGDWNRDLAHDLDAIRNWGSGAVVTLMETEELRRYRVAGLGKAVMQRGMAWFHLPIVDGDVPNAAFERAWQTDGVILRGLLARGGKVVIHCRGGLGRTGLLAARLLVENGATPDTAIRTVRVARPGAIETLAQEDHVRTVKAVGG